MATACQPNVRSPARAGRRVTPTPAESAPLFEARPSGSEARGPCPTRPDPEPRIPPAEHWPGFLTELTFARGAWGWIHRRPDLADVAVAAWLRGRGQRERIAAGDGQGARLLPGARIYEHAGRLVNYVTLAAMYRQEHGGCPPGARPADRSSEASC